MTRFDGQVVIVTGAASGIGLGIARAFHDAGASVVLGDVQQDALDQAQATFSDQKRVAFVRPTCAMRRRSQVLSQTPSRRLGHLRS